VLALCPHPTNDNSVIVADLGRDVGSLLDLDSERLREALFTRGEHERPPLKEIRLNRVPFVAPPGTVRAEDRRRLGWDLERVDANAAKLKGNSTVRERVAEVYEREPREPAIDVDAALYDGFLSDADRQRCGRVLSALMADLPPPSQDFQDERIPELVFRLRARRDPRLLSESELQAWRDDVASRLSAANAPWMTLARLGDALGRLEPRSEPAKTMLEEHVARVSRWFEGDDF
jgi:exodeoxyribonuclease-1